MLYCEIHLEWERAGAQGQTSHQTWQFFCKDVCKHIYTLTETHVQNDPVQYTLFPAELSKTINVVIHLAALSG